MSSDPHAAARGSLGLSEADRRLLGQLASGDVTPKALDVGSDADSRLSDAPLDPDTAGLSTFVRDRERGAGGKIPPPLCEFVTDQYEHDDDLSLQTLAASLGVDYRTVRYHVQGECHHSQGCVTRRQCNAIRAAAHDGRSYVAIADLFSFVSTRQHAHKHATGQCTCDAGVEPVNPPDP